MQASDLTPPTKMSISAILKEGWQKTYGIKSQINWGLIIVLLLNIIFFYIFHKNVLDMYKDFPDHIKPLSTLYSSNLSFLYGSVISFFTILVTCSPAKIALEKCLNNSKLSFIEAFYFSCKKIKDIIIIYFFSAIPGLLLLSPLSLKYSLIINLLSILAVPINLFAYRDIMVRDVSAITAVIESLQRIWGWWLKCIVLFFILEIAVIASILFLLIPIIWLYPLYNTVTAILYREVYGIKRVDTENEISAKK